MDTLGQGEEEILRALTESMRRWGRRYPAAGYGGRFDQWLASPDPKPYHSWGNGSAMRVSSAGWLFDTLEETRQAAARTARVTHDHPEGIKGAEAAASAVFLARAGAGKGEIRDYISTGSPLDKAGAYGAQDMAALFVERIDGEFYTVVGLPLCRLGRMLKAFGAEIMTEHA